MGLSEVHFKLKIKKKQKKQLCGLCDFESWNRYATEHFKEKSKSDIFARALNNWFCQLLQHVTVNRDREESKMMKNAKDFGIL